MGQLVSIFIINQDLTNIITQIITDYTNNNVTFTVDQEGGRFFGCHLDTAPDLVLVIKIPL